MEGAENLENGGESAPGNPMLIPPRGKGNRFQHNQIANCVGERKIEQGLKREQKITKVPTVGERIFEQGLMREQKT